MELKLSKMKVGFIEDGLIASQEQYDRREVFDLISDWRNMRDEVDRLLASILSMENDTACLPEDVGVTEYVSALRSELSTCREAAGVPPEESLLSWIKQMKADNAKLIERNIELSAEVNGVIVAALNVARANGVKVL